MIALPDLKPRDLPWSRANALLLDAVQVEDLYPLLCNWGHSVDIDVLYMGTSWQGLQAVSPCLVSLNGPSAQALASFIAHREQRCGYLLFSDAPWKELLAHLRWLTTLNHPSGQPFLAKLADPRIAHALFHDIGQADTRLFGPCQHIIAATGDQALWHQYTRPDTPSENRPDYTAPYSLNDLQWQAFEAASAQRQLDDLTAHLQRVFPGQTAAANVRAQVERAQGLGLHSERQIWQFLNLTALIGHNDVDPTSELFDLIRTHSPIPFAQSLQRCEFLAEQLAATSLEP